MLGYRHELEQAALAFDPALVRYSKDEPLYDILQRWLRNGVTAVLNFNEDLALEVIHILSNVFRLQIGKDISTITLEDLPVYQYLSPPQNGPSASRWTKLARIARRQNCLNSRAQPSRSQGEVLDICLHGELLERDSVASPSLVRAKRRHSGTHEKMTMQWHWNLKRIWRHHARDGANIQRRFTLIW